MAIYRARIEFLPSYHIMYKNKNNIHDRFVSAQPHSLQLSGGKNDLFSPSPLRGSGRKCHFCLPQAEVNSVVPRQNERECYIVGNKLETFFFKISGIKNGVEDLKCLALFLNTTYIPSVKEAVILDPGGFEKKVRRLTWLIL